MRGKLYTEKNKEKVKQLLLDGKSYKEVDKLLDIPKSTISTWFGKTLERPINKQVRLKHFARIQKLGVAALKKKWEKKRIEEIQLIKTKIRKEIRHYPFENNGFYKSLLAMLYWAEGTKHQHASGSKFANTDPNLIKLYVTLLRKCYPIDEGKFSIGLHLHYYHSIKKTRKFWSELIDIPTSRFYKIYVKKRSKTRRFRKNFAGICFIYYGDSRIRKELLELGSVLQKIITTNAPVA